MKPSLKDHPFAVEAFFRKSIVITYALPRQDIEALLPASLEADVFDNRWAFVALAVVDSRALRPRGFPVWAGNDFMLAGFRIFVKYRTNAGKQLRGLYILKSETNNPRMTWLGNMFTHYKYSTSDIRIQEQASDLHISSNRSGIDIRLQANAEPAPLPSASPFRSWTEARRYAGPLPFTFSYDAASQQMLIIQGMRSGWKPEPLAIRKAEAAFLGRESFANAVPAGAFIVRDIPYWWKKGRKEAWKQ